MILVYIKKRLQSHDNTQYSSAFKLFQVTIGNSKCVKNFKFQKDSPMLKYCQKSLNICRLGSLESAFASIEQTKAANAIPLSIE